jgi:hypothetical protein
MDQRRIDHLSREAQGTRDRLPPTDQGRIDQAVSQPPIQTPYQAIMTGTPPQAHGRAESASAGLNFGQQHFCASEPGESGDSSQLISPYQQHSSAPNAVQGQMQLRHHSQQTPSYTNLDYLDLGAPQGYAGAQNYYTPGTSAPNTVQGHMQLGNFSQQPPSYMNMDYLSQGTSRGYVGAHGHYLPVPSAPPASQPQTQPIFSTKGSSPSQQRPSPLRKRTRVSESASSSPAPQSIRSHNPSPRAQRTRRAAPKALPPPRLPPYTWRCCECARRNRPNTGNTAMARHCYAPVPGTTLLCNHRFCGTHEGDDRSKCCKV